MGRITPVFLATVLAAMADAMPAFAHAFLTRATPAVGGTVAESPPALNLFYTEGVVPEFSTVRVMDHHGQAVSNSKPHLADGNDRELVVSLPKLAPGSYTVSWHATARDTHKTQGQFHFTVAPPAS